MTYNVSIKKNKSPVSILEIKEIKIRNVKLISDRIRHPRPTFGTLIDINLSKLRIIKLADAKGSNPS